MNVLEKIIKLRDERGWSTYRLSQEAGLTQSTVSNMFSRKTVPSIKTLSSICDAFNISLSEFFSEKDDSLPKDEIIIAEKYKKLSPEQKKAFLVLLDSVSRY